MGDIADWHVEQFWMPSDGLSSYEDYEEEREMPKATGIVKYVNERPGKYGPMYSLKLEGDDTNYGTKGTKPACNVGDAVEFNFTVNPRGYSDADPASISVVEANAAPEVAAEAAAAPTAGRVAFDKKQAVICYQAARNSALELIKLAASLDTLDLPKKGTVADRFNAIRIFVDEATDDYFTTSMEVYNTGKLPEAD